MKRYKSSSEEFLEICDDLIDDIQGNQNVLPDTIEPEEIIHSVNLKKEEKNDKS